jgi:hypothetical protein
MKLSSITSASLAVLSALAGTASANQCVYKGNEMVLWGWIIMADGVGDVPAVCGGLWDNMKRFGACTLTNTHCWEVEPGRIRWEFYSPTTCGPGHVESSWWEETRNQYGEINCFRAY